jgi:uncharacterized protein (DUF885 family)
MHGFLTSRLVGPAGSTSLIAMKRLLGIGCVVWSVTAAIAQTAFERGCDEIAARNGQDAARLHELFKLHWEHEMSESPESATYNGYPGQSHRWVDLSLTAIERRRRELKSPIKAIHSISRSKLEVPDQLSHDLFKRNSILALEGARFPEEYLQLTQLNGVHQDVAALVELMPRFTSNDYENIVARLKGVSLLVDQTLALLKAGVARGITPSKITLRDVPQQLKNQLTADAAQCAFMRPFDQMPDAIPTTEQARLRREARSAIEEEVFPAFRRLHEFLVVEYLPKAREPIAMTAMPDGQDWYAFRARQHTTTSLSPTEIHELGLGEVKRIRAEMDQVIAQVGTQGEFKGGFDEFLEFLRKDPRFYYRTGDDLLASYRNICKRADSGLMQLFGRLPRQQYGVLPVPSYAEQSQTTAYYQPGSTRLGRAGVFFANTYAIGTRPKWEMEALSLHEAVPGHHLQLALADELEGVPDFRKYGQYTAFVEGWGLYSESLGSALGFYTDPYSRFGQLTYEMWRAVRLVVDTGMHALGWSRQRAIDYFKANASKNEHDITVEVDRYIAWPGQALAYKIGELKIKELRAYATKALGPKFDIRAFHDEMLGNGALPLDVLETHIKQWVQTQVGASLPDAPAIPAR